MARFFGRNKNQAEMDFRRFEQEIHINSKRPSDSSDQKQEAYYQEYDSPSLSSRLSTLNPAYDKRGPQHPPRQERFEPRSPHAQHHLRPNPELRHSPNTPSQENELYNFCASAKL